MKRREFLKRSAAVSLAAVIPSSVLARVHEAPAAANPLPAPARGRIPVAFLLSPGAVMIDFAGP